MYTYNLAPNSHRICFSGQGFDPNLEKENRKRFVNCGDPKSLKCLPETVNLTFNKGTFSSYVRQSDQFYAFGMPS